MKFDIKQKGRKSPVIRVLKSHATMALGILTTFLLFDPKALRDRLKLLIQQKPAGNNSGLITEKVVAIVDKLLEYECISKKQHKILLHKYSN